MSDFPTKEQQAVLREAAEFVERHPTGFRNDPEQTPIDNLAKALRAMLPEPRFFRRSGAVFELEATTAGRVFLAPVHLAPSRREALATKVCAMLNEEVEG